MANFVVDTGFLRLPALGGFLGESSFNTVAVTQATQLETLGGSDPIGNIRAAMTHLERFHRQVVILRDPVQITMEHERSGGRLRREDLIDQEATTGFGRTCNVALDAAAGVQESATHILNAAAAARADTERLWQGAHALALGIREYGIELGAAITKKIRGSKRLDAAEQAAVWKGTMHLARAFFDNYTDGGLRLPEQNVLPTSLLFRHALASHLLVLWWIRHGGVESASESKLANDVRDIQIAAFATYFDGLLSADEKLKSIHADLRLMLRKLFRVRCGA